MNPCVAMDYIESCLKIKTKSGTVVPFRLNDAQRKLYAVAKRQQDAGKPVRLIILKARQLGFSTLTEGLIFHACATRRNVNALIVAHREDATANLFRMSKLFYDELPAPVKPMLRASNAQELVFENPSKLRSEREARPGLRSRIRCATAGGRGIGRSDTLQCVHLSEYAFWPDGADGKASTLAGILQAVPSLPGTMVVIESTANGFEDFKERWDAAVAGENDFEPVFFAWFENPDYSMPVVPGTEWTPEERDLKAAYRLTDGQLQWRRWCIANNCGGSLDMFRQEYPASPGEAFLHSGTGVFDNEQIVLRLERLSGPAGRGEFTNGEWTESETGAITLYEMPEEGVPYVLGGDTAAFEYLFDRYRDAIHRLFVQRLGGVNDADDLLQETFIKVYINLHRYSADYTFGQWVYTIARNTFIDFVRRRQDDLPIDERFAAPASNAPTPEESVINLQQRSQIEHYLEHLAPRYRQLILMRFFEEYSYEEIAAKLSLPLGTVKTQIHRAREQMCRLIAQGDER